MSTIQPLTSGQTVAATSAPKNTLGKDDFLSLLITQMQNQDPLDPMKGTEFASQLAQFSSLEQLTNINTNLGSSLNAQSVLSSSINNALATTFIGKEVRANSSSFNYTNSGTVQMGYTLPTDASAVSVKIYDGNGNLVKTLKGGTSTGDSTVTWDGTNDGGQPMANGTYTFKVEATDSTGGSIATSSYIFGKVTGIRFKSDGTVFVIDGAEISLSNILEIMQG